MLNIDSIWRAYCASGKRHIFITGNRGSGKTTLFDKFTLKTYIKTCAIPKDYVEMQIYPSKEKGIIGVYDANIGGISNKMRPCDDVISMFGVNGINQLIKTNEDFVGIDEIGYIESQNEAYKSAVNDLLSVKNVIAVVRKQNDITFLCDLINRNDAFVVDMNNITNNIGCIIMASGEGKRFGENKLLADFDGEPLINSILKATDIFENRVIVTKHKEIADIAEELGIECIFHNYPNRNDTVRLGIEKMYNCDYCIFCQADQPLVSKDSLWGMSILTQNSNSKIVRAAFADVEGAPVIFPKRCFDELLCLPEGKGGRYLIKKNGETTLKYMVSRREELMDIDTRDDLERLLKLK